MKLFTEFDKTQLPLIILITIIGLIIFFLAKERITDFRPGAYNRYYESYEFSEPH